MDDISVLICDDSALMRNMIGRIIEDTQGFKLVGKAENGLDLLDKIPETKPDVILLDIEMPKMNGIEFLKEKKNRNIDIPVIILSSLAKKGAAITMQCLELGASDFITKPGSSVTLTISDVSEEIITLVASYGGAYATLHHKLVQVTDFFTHQVKLKEAQKFVIKKKGEEAAKAASIKANEVSFSTPFTVRTKDPVVIKPEREGGKIEVIAIGISTGGPNALRDVFKAIDPNLKQPILVVQHMPEGFTEEFAASLDQLCPLKVTEAKDGEVIEGAHVYIARGGYHMYVEHKITGNVLRLSKDDPRNGHRPSVDVLFESIANVYLNKSLGVIMTGMGRDGAAELAEMRKKGAWTLGQDQASSIVYGMPRVGWELGGVQKQVSLAEMAGEISKLAKEHLLG